MSCMTGCFHTYIHVYVHNNHTFACGYRVYIYITHGICLTLRAASTFDSENFIRFDGEKGSGELLYTLSEETKINKVSCD